MSNQSTIEIRYPHTDHRIYVNLLPLPGLAPERDTLASVAKALRHASRNEYLNDFEHVTSAVIQQCAVDLHRPRVGPIPPMRQLVDRTYIVLRLDIHMIIADSETLGPLEPWCWDYNIDTPYDNEYNMTARYNR